jgi:monoamine oxidase
LCLCAAPCVMPCRCLCEKSVRRRFTQVDGPTRVECRRTQVGVGETAAISRVGPLHEIHDLSGPTGSPAALFGFARSGFDELNHSEIRNQFARIFGERAASSQELLIKDWGRQPWANPQGDSGVGSPNYGMFGHEVYQHSYLDGRLHWCSTETAPHYAGHIEGALEAAERTLINISRLNS